MKVSNFDFEGEWLSDLATTEVVVVQVAPSSAESLIADAPRPVNVTTLSQLLGETNRLEQIVSGTKPTILIVPELAFGHSDWAALDALVRSCGRPILLVAGFGFTLGASLREWHAATGETTRVASWDDTCLPASTRRYNGGWCWVRSPNGQTTCITFLKTTAEQYAEIHVPDLDFGETLACIRLSDLVVFPLICSDMLAEEAGAWIVQGKVREAIVDAAETRKVLVLGLLYQKKPHEKWRTAVADLARSINRQRVNICISNTACELLSFSEDDDRWRNYSGAFLSAGRHPRVDHFDHVRRFSTESLDAAVVRRTTPVVLGGPLRWTFSTTGRHIWTGKGFAVGQDGILNDPGAVEIYSFELLRLIERLTGATDAPSIFNASFLKEAIETIAVQIRSGSSPTAEALCVSTLFGEWTTSNAKRLNPDQLADYVLPLAAGLKAIGLLRRDLDYAWQAEALGRGQLLSSPDSTAVLVWSTPDPAISVRNTLNAWRSDVHSAPLLVFWKSFGSGYPPPDPVSERRRDISSSPQSSGRSVDEAALPEVIVELSLDQLELCAATFGDDERKDALSHSIATGLASFASEGRGPQ